MSERDAVAATRGDSELTALIGIAGGAAPQVQYLGVRALMLAVLDDAICAYLGPLPRDREDAEMWIMNDRSRSVFSFNTVCETLGLEPPAVRQALRKLAARSVSRGRRAFLRARPNTRRQSGLRIVVPRGRPCRDAAGG